MYINKKKTNNTHSVGVLHETGRCTRVVVVVVLSSYRIRVRSTRRIRQNAQVTSSKMSILLKKKTKFFYRVRDSLPPLPVGTFMTSVKRFFFFLLLFQLLLVVG